MLHTDKVELIELLNEFKRLLPPVEKREAFTNHYAKLEKRIDQAKSKLMDQDYKHIQQVNSKLLGLQLKGKITMDEYVRLAKADPE